MIRRRTLLGSLAAAAVAPTVLRAQVPQRPVIGFLNGQPSASVAHLVGALRIGLGSRGYFEGVNLAISYRWAELGSNDLVALARDLLNDGPNVLFVAGGDVAIEVAQEATARVPIVFVTGSDPVAAGFVGSLSQPDGNLTGISLFAVSLEQKRLELLHTLLPGVRTISVLLDPGPTYPLISRQLEAAAARLGVGLRLLVAGSEADIDAAFAVMAADGTEALMVAGDSFYFSRREQIVRLANRARIPAFYTQREYVLAGGLISYGTSIASAYRNAGAYLGRILDGEAVADLPVMQATDFEFVVNLDAARALGLDIAPEVMVAATEFVE